MKERKRYLTNERKERKKVKFIPHVAMHFKSRIDNSYEYVVVVVVAAAAAGVVVVVVNGSFYIQSSVFSVVVTI